VHCTAVTHPYCDVCLLGGTLAPTALTATRTFMATRLVHSSLGVDS
jgi:hypothetical protein